ncbi:MAG: hypothetical protein ACHQYP_04835 [Nitrospiria bacterium]
MRNQIGKITVGLTLFLVSIALALHASFQIVPIYMDYLNFKSEIQSRAREPQQDSEEYRNKIRTALTNKAVELNIPLDPESLKIEFGDHITHIIASWSVEAKFIDGRFSKKLPFSVDVTEPNYRS